MQSGQTLILCCRSRLRLMLNWSRPPAASPSIHEHPDIDQTIEGAAKRQSGLEAAKAAFFASAGQSRLITIGMGKDSPGAEQLPKPVYGYRTIEAPKKKRGRFISEEERLALAGQLMECKANGMTRYKAAKHLGISETLCRSLISDHSLNFPAST